MKVEEKLALDAFKNSATSHIVLDVAVCARCADKPCIPACPAALYQVEPASGKVIVEHAGCLECGTCMVICPLGSVSWAYPEAGFGVRYRHG